jgi:hypothetical protein
LPRFALNSGEEGPTEKPIAFGETPRSLACLTMSSESCRCPDPRMMSGFFPLMAVSKALTSCAFVG